MTLQPTFFALSCSVQLPGFSLTGPFRPPQNPSAPIVFSANPSGMNTYKKRVRNPFQMNTCRTLDLKSLCFQHLQKIGGGGWLLLTSTPSRSPAVSFRQPSLYDFGKFGSAFTSRICIVCRRVCPEISSTHWYASSVP